MLDLLLLCRNEADRWLKPMLEAVLPAVDRVVCLDDASTDATMEMVIDLCGDKLALLFSATESRFERDESNLRRQLWRLADEIGTEWRLCLDADELIDPACVPALRDVATWPGPGRISFRLYDMWDEHHYRDDPLWCAHNGYFWPLLRVPAGFQPEWRGWPVHGGRTPVNIWGFEAVYRDWPIQHMGWVGEENRRRKYERYMRHDPGARYGNADQYQSILDPAPRLRPWPPR